MPDDFGSMNVEEAFNQPRPPSSPLIPEQGQGVPSRETAIGTSVTEQRTATELNAGIDPAKIALWQNVRSNLDRLATCETIMNNLLRMVWNGQEPDMAILKVWLKALGTSLPLATAAVTELEALIDKDAQR